MTVEDFYRDNYHIVYGYLLSLSGNVTLAEDMASETFLRAIQRFESFDLNVKASTWLCAIARNLYLDELRRQKRFTGAEPPDSPDPASFEEAYADSDDAAAIFRLAARLPDIQRQIFLMRAGGLSFRDIGNALNISETRARVTFFRTKNAILEEMGEK